MHLETNPGAEDDFSKSAYSHSYRVQDTLIVFLVGIILIFNFFLILLNWINYNFNKSSLKLWLFQRKLPHYVPAPWNSWKYLPLNIFIASFSREITLNIFQSALKTGSKNVYLCQSKTLLQSHFKLLTLKLANMGAIYKYTGKFNKRRVVKALQCVSCYLKRAK